MEFHFTKTHPDAVAPTKSYPTDSGWDVTVLSLDKEFDDGNVHLYNSHLTVKPPPGYYFDTNVSNQNLIRSISKKDQQKTTKLEEAQLKGLIEDRKLLTGSLNTNIIGKVASSRAEKLYPKSFFNKKF